MSGSLLLCDIAVPVDRVDGNQNTSVASKEKKEKDRKKYKLAIVSVDGISTSVVKYQDSQASVNTLI